MLTRLGISILVLNGQGSPKRCRTTKQFQTRQSSKYAEIHVTRQYFEASGPGSLKRQKKIRSTHGEYMYEIPIFRLVSRMAHKVTDIQAKIRISTAYTRLEDSIFTYFKKVKQTTFYRFKIISFSLSLCIYKNCGIVVFGH